MKILIINDKLISGGAEIYSNNLKNILEKEGNEVYYMFFEGENIYYEDKSYIKITEHPGRLINKIFINPFLYKKIVKYIKKINPDKIILNNIFIAPITILKSIKGREVYQITHDYSIVCCSGDCIKKDKSICKGYRYEKCNQCNHFANSFKMRIKNINHRRIEKIRKKIIKIHISPSRKLYEYLNDYGYNSICINNPIYLNEPPKKIYLNKKTKEYVYIGSINERKGIFEFIEAFNVFCKEKDVKLTIIGQPDSELNKERLLNITYKNNKIDILGYMENSLVRKRVEESFCLVVPSMWMENYPTVVLEGMAARTLVIGSNRGGIPEMLENGRGVLFDILDRENIISVLQEVYNIKENEYNKITDKCIKYLNENNTYEIYSEKISNILNS